MIFSSKHDYESEGRFMYRWSISVLAKCRGVLISTLEFVATISF